MLTTGITLHHFNYFILSYSIIYHSRFKNLSYCQTADNIQYRIAKTPHYHKEDEFSHSHYNAHKVKPNAHLNDI